VRKLIADTHGDVPASAKLVQDNAPIRSQLIEQMQQELGNAFVQKVMQEIRHAGTTDAANAELANVAAGCKTEKVSLQTRTATSASVIKGAIGNGDRVALAQAVESSAAALDEAELHITMSRQELDNAEKKDSAAWKTGDAACRDLDKLVSQRAAEILVALALPNAATSPGGGDSLATDIRGRGRAMAVRLEGANKVTETTAHAATLHGKARFDAAQRVRDQLVLLPTADRAFVVSIIRAHSAPQDIVDFYEGKGQALRAVGGSIEVGGGGNGAGDAAGQGGFSASPATLNKPGADQKLSADGTTGQFGGSVDKKLGTAGDGVTKGTASYGAGADFRADDGSMRFEGGNFSAGYSMPGQPSIKVNGGYTQSTSPPTFDGKNWIVAWSVSESAGAGTGRSTTSSAPVTTLNGTPKGSGASAGGDLKLSGSYLKGGSKVYPDAASAQKAYTDGAFEIQDPDLLSHKLPDTGHVLGMKDGETATLGQGGDIGISGNVGMSGVSASLGGNAGDSTDVKMTRAPNNKLLVTFREVGHQGASGSIGTTGISGGGGLGRATATSVTCEFDLSTEAGKAAYATWSADSTKTPIETTGVRIISRGTGSFSSSNVGIGVGITALNGSASTTATTGEFVEKTADGKHNQSTIVGTNADNIKDFSLITPDKKVRSDSLEITTTDGDTANSSYVIKTAVQGQADAAWTNGELGKTMGEPNATGNALDGAKSSGKWAIEGSYTKAQIDDFQKRVANGSVTLTNHPGSAELKAVLKCPQSSEKDKQNAMAQWFATRGPEASSDLRTTIGTPTMNVALDGDKYLTGSAGFAAAEGKRIELEDRFLDPKLEGDAVKKLLQDVQALYADQLEKRDHVANLVNYPELPNALRHELVKQVQGNYEKIAALRNRVAARAKEAGLGDPGTNPVLNMEMRTVSTHRTETTKLRGQAVDRRAKHNGALSAGHGSSPRDALIGRTGVGTEKIGELYKKSDMAWTSGIQMMTTAVEHERQMYREDCLDKKSQDAAIAVGGAARNCYDSAQRLFAESIADLDVIYQQALKHPTPVTPKTMWEATPAAKPVERAPRPRSRKNKAGSPGSRRCSTARSTDASSVSAWQPALHASPRSCRGCDARPRPSKPTAHR